MRAVLLSLLLALAACEATDDLTWRDAGRAVVNVARLSVLLPPLPSEDGEPTRLDIPRSAFPDARDYAASGQPLLRIAYGSQTKYFHLLQSNGEGRVWRSDDGTVVSMEGARIVATSGPRIWVAATRFDGPDPLDDPQTLLERPVATRRIVDLMSANRAPDRMRFGLSLECRLRAAQLTEGVVVEERCGGGARFVNRFWVDPASGGVWRSEQWVGLEDRPMFVEVVVPPNG